ncbi:MAG: hypothetical protein KIS92_00015 [Planctomycetota bacterium]|nr:hypothetical protein [Planctomycetota bacterium]
MTQTDAPVYAESVQRRSRSAPALPIPYARPSGALFVALGSVGLLLLCVADPGALKSYWTVGMPGLYGLGAGTVIAGGLILLYGTFTLRLLLVAVMLVASSAMLAQATAFARTRVTLVGAGYEAISLAMPDHWSPMYEDERLVNDGIFGTLARFRVFPQDRSVACATVVPETWELYFRAKEHSQPALKGFEEVLRIYIRQRNRMLESPQGPVRKELARECVGAVYEGVAARWGPEAARMVCRACAPLVRDAELREAFGFVDRGLTY